MRKPTLKSLMTRLEKLAKSEYRDIEGQLRCVLDHYESSRPMPIKVSEPKQKRAYTKRQKDQRPELVLTSPEMPKQRKPRSDIGKKRKPYNVTKTRSPMSKQHRKNISMGRKLANARRKLAELTNPVGATTS